MKKTKQPVGGLLFFDGKNFTNHPPIGLLEAAIQKLKHRHQEMQGGLLKDTTKRDKPKV